MDYRMIKRKPNTLYKRIFLALFVLTAFILAGLASLLYVAFENAFLQNIHSTVADNLSKISYSATLMRQSATTLMVQMREDSDIKQLLFGDAADELGDMPLTRLGQYRSVMPFIHSIHVYNGKNGLVYSTASNKRINRFKEFFDQDILSLIRKETPGIHLTPIPRVVREQTSPTETGFHVYTFLFYNNRQSVSRDESIIILNISEEWMRNMIHSLEGSNSSNTFITDRQGRILSGSENQKFLTDLSMEPYMKSILASKKRSGYFSTMIQGEKNLVSYATSSSYGWIFINLTPYDRLLEKAKAVRDVTLLAALLTLLVAFLLSFVVSRRLYKPISSVLSDLNQLEREKTSNSYMLKQQFLKNLVLAPEYPFGKDLGAKFMEQGIVLNPESPVRVILFCIDRYADFCSRHHGRDHGLMKFAIANILAELAAERFPRIEVSEMEEDRLLLLIEEPIRWNEQELRQFLQQASETVRQYLGISLSAVIGEGYTPIAEIGRQYNKAVYSSMYRMMEGHGSILYLQTKENFSDKYEFPASDEADLVESLMLGKPDQAKSSFDRILEHARSFSPEVVGMSFLHLAFAIQGALRTIEKNSGWQVSFNFNHFMSQLSHLETLEEIKNHFYGLIDNVILMTEERKDSKHELLLKQVMGIIEEKYSDPSLSVESIAEMIDLSPVYLGRLFKKYMARTLTETITEVRIERAKQILLSSDIPIGEISGKVGFISSSYFHTVFKKLHGITPSEYRQHQGRQ